MIFLVRLLLVLTVFLTGLTRAGAANELRDLEEILFTGDPNPAASTISIWNRDILWRSSGTNDQYSAEVRAAVGEMNNALKAAPFKLIEAKTEPPTLLIAFVPASQLRNMKTRRMAFRPGRLGQTFTFKGPDGSISNGGIFIADNLPDISRKYALRHELMHAMGIPKHTTHSFNSILRRNWQISSAPGAFLAFDRKVIDFVYRYLKPGHTKSDVRRIFGRKWAR